MTRRGHLRHQAGHISICPCRPHSPEQVGSQVLEDALDEARSQRRGRDRSRSGIRAKAAETDKIKSAGAAEAIEAATSKEAMKPIDAPVVLPTTEGEAVYFDPGSASSREQSG